MKVSLLSLICCCALAPLAASAQNYSGEWSFFGYYMWADMEGGYDPFETETYDFLPPFTLQQHGSGYTASIAGEGITLPLSKSAQGDFFEYYDVEASSGSQYNLRVRMMPIADDLLFIQQTGATFGRRLSGGQTETVLLDFETLIGVLTPDGFQTVPLGNIEGEYRITSMSTYGTTSVSNVASFGASSLQENERSGGYMTRTGNGQFQFKTGNLVMNLTDYGTDELGYTYYSEANGRNQLHEIRVLSLSGDRLLIVIGEADDAAGIVPMASTEIWLARKVSNNTGDAFPFFPGAGYPDAGGWIQWKNEWFYTLDAPWFYSYRTDWTYIEGNDDPSYMWWWSWHFDGTGQGEWMWTNDVYFPWVWLATDNWYNVSTF